MVRAMVLCGLLYIRYDLSSLSIFALFCLIVSNLFSLQDRSVELRAEMLQYLAFHSANQVHAPAELLEFRTVESHPAFHPFFY